MSLNRTQLVGTFNDFFSRHREPEGRIELSAGQRNFSKSAAQIQVVEAAPAPIQQYSIQNQLRPAYGKGAASPRSIGNHPDFEHFAGTQLSCTCPIVTLFMDIENSTRLGLFYSNAEVARIKNAFLCAAIELVHTFDGHVHRIMGDAVMAFFGGESQKAENAVVDAINCASTLWLFVKSTVIPRLREEGFDEDFGVRIGVDYAPDAHWSAFGFRGTDEVSAAAFEVDAASKLQHAAGRNQVMLGQRLLDFVDLPGVVTRTKTVSRDGVTVDEPFLKPNHQLPSGQLHNYRQALLNVEEYLRCSPLAAAAAEVIHDPRLQPLSVNVTLHESIDGPIIGPYAPASAMMPKGLWIKFSLSLPFQPQLPFDIVFAVENHGQQADADNTQGSGNHESTQHITRYNSLEIINHWEHSAYRGLHYMTITVRDRTKVVTRRRIGVFIE